MYYNIAYLFPYIFCEKLRAYLLWSGFCCRWKDDFRLFRTDIWIGKEEEKTHGQMLLIRPKQIRTIFKSQRNRFLLLLSTYFYFFYVFTVCMCLIQSQRKLFGRNQMNSKKKLGFLPFWPNGIRYFFFSAEKSTLITNST